MAAIGRRGRRGLSGRLAFAWPLSTGALDYRSNFDGRLLAAQNRERASLGLPPLRWAPDLATGARQWSDHLARTAGFSHSPDTPGEELLGENIWGGDPGAFAPEAMIGLWIGEKRNFQLGTFPHNSRTGRVADVSHYTQLIWRSTTEVGCALSRGAAEEILVCRYRHPGNVIGQQVF